MQHLTVCLYIMVQLNPLWVNLHGQKWDLAFDFLDPKIDRTQKWICCEKASRLSEKGLGLTKYLSLGRRRKMHIYVWGQSPLGAWSTSCFCHLTLCYRLHCTLSCATLCYTQNFAILNTLPYSTLCFTEHFAILNTLLHPTLCYRLHCTLSCAIHLNSINCPQFHIFRLCLIFRLITLAPKIHSLHTLLVQHTSTQ